MGCDITQRKVHTRILPADFRWQSYTPSGFYSDNWLTLESNSTLVVPLQNFLSDDQRINLIRLAAYLHLYAAIPDEKTVLSRWKQSHGFSMKNFTDESKDSETRHECGTVGCVAGHGPYAGIPKRFEDWFNYTMRCFGGLCTPLLVKTHRENNALMWSWVFSADWQWTDDTPEGAARRIDFALVYGVPKNAKRQAEGDEKLYYIVPTRT